MSNNMVVKCRHDTGMTQFSHVAHIYWSIMLKEATNDAIGYPIFFGIIPKKLDFT